jgi:hypothetical protein
MKEIVTGNSWRDFTVADALRWLAIVALWLVVTRYARIEHDAQLYSFQAIARLHPELFSGDIYLRYGSQDDFSMFSVLYARVVAWLGFEGAAAWTTFVSMLALLFVSWRLAKRLVPAPLALLAVGFLIALPKGYGGFGIFRVVEPFVSPRMPAEALAVCAFIAMLAERRLLASLLLLASAGMHPLMAAPAALIVLFLAIPPPRRWMLAAAGAAGLVLLALVGSLPLFDPLRVDAQWREYFDNFAANLYLVNWSHADWMRLCPPALTLLLGASTLESPQARQLCRAALLVAALGMAIMAVGADWLQIAIIVKGQAYRWAWPSSLLAPLLLPAIAVQLWRLGTNGRAAVLALAALWLAAGESSGPVIAVAALLIAVIAVRDLVAPDYRRWVLLGAALMLLIAVAFTVGERLLVAENPFWQTEMTGPIDDLRYLFIGGLIPAVLLICVFWLAQSSRWQPLQAIAGLALLAACVALVPDSVANWSLRGYPAAVHDKFAAWRALIPPRSEVVWIDKPEAVWLLLERPSYYSLQQGMSGVFARAAVPEILLRESRLVPFMMADNLRAELDFVPPRRRAGHFAARSLQQVCKAVDARFVVARSAFKEAPLAVAPPDVPATYRAMKLYRCDSPSP